MVAYTVSGATGPTGGGGGIKGLAKASSCDCELPIHLIIATAPRTHFVKRAVVDCRVGRMV